MGIFYNDGSLLNLFFLNYSAFKNTQAKTI